MTSYHIKINKQKQPQLTRICQTLQNTAKENYKNRDI